MNPTRGYGVKQTRRAPSAVESPEWSEQRGRSQRRYSRPRWFACRSCSTNAPVRAKRRTSAPLPCLRAITITALARNSAVLRQAAAINPPYRPRRWQASRPFPPESRSSWRCRPRLHSSRVRVLSSPFRRTRLPGQPVQSTRVLFLCAFSTRICCRRTPFGRARLPTVQRERSWVSVDAGWC